MPSGNAIYTYIGPDEHITIQGQVFLKDQPKHITDQGVIAACAGREDFTRPLIFHASISSDLNGDGIALTSASFDLPEEVIEKTAACLSDPSKQVPAKPDGVTSMATSAYDKVDGDVLHLSAKPKKEVSAELEAVYSAHPEVDPRAVRVSAKPKKAKSK